MKIFINESKLREIVEESVRKILREEDVITDSFKNTIMEDYHLSDPEEIIEYMWVKPNKSGVRVDLFVDDGGSFKLHNHQLLLLARNGYDKSCDEFIPFSITEHPQILDRTIDYKISYDDIFLIQDFIQVNLRSLILLANRMMGQREFFENMRMVFEPQFAYVNESKEILDEMATLRKEESNLPVDLWLDENGRYMGHAPRIKFRASNEQRTTREFSSMLLTNPPTIENFPKNSPMKNKDVKKIEKFVIDNMEQLRLLADGKIDYNDDFLPNMLID